MQCLRVSEALNTRGVQKRGDRTYKSHIRDLCTKISGVSHGEFIFVLPRVCDDIHSGANYSERRLDQLTYLILSRDDICYLRRTFADC